MIVVSRERPFGSFSENVLSQKISYFRLLMAYMTLLWYFLEISEVGVRSGCRVRTHRYQETYIEGDGRSALSNFDDHKVIVAKTMGLIGNSLSTLIWLHFQSDTHTRTHSLTHPSTHTHGRAIADISIYTIRVRDKFIILYICVGRTANVETVRTVSFH